TGLTGAHPLNAPIVGMAADPSAGGYWIVGSDGGVFNFGAAPFLGSEGGKQISGPVVGISSVDTMTGTASPPLAQASVTPLTITTSSLPNATVLASYSAQLSAAGGNGAYRWSATGLPSGVGIGATDGVIGGSPTSATDASIVVTVADAAGATASTQLTLTVMPYLNSGLLSYNWSGYVAVSGPFNKVTGTFTVPTLSSTQPLACANGSQVCMFSDWVGIDGASNSNLIQAGVAEYPDFNTNQQMTGVTIFPWWEILPNSSVSLPTTAMTVAAGNTITVQISEVVQGTWSIEIVDDTTGQSYSPPPESYSGQGTSAEWIVEAPTVNGTTATLSPYSTVQFTNTGYSLAPSGGLQGYDQIALVQSGSIVSMPNQLGLNDSLASGGSFSVSYKSPG
ncbi:MAG: G1 family glutamic endopeptidase, partial [Ferrimicrobium sp.]